MGRKSDWLVLKKYRTSNPLIVRKDAVCFLAPDATDEFKTLLYLKGQEKPLFIDQTTSSIEEQM